MATIKLQPSGKVVLKDGKVACACCLCCLYPATQAVEADLPDAITLLGVGSLSKSGTDYGDTTNGVILESGVWARYVGGVRTTNSCLITGDGNLTPGNNLVEDQFEPAYEVSNGLDKFPPSTCTVTRDSKCAWSYTDPLLAAHIAAGGDIFNYEEAFTDDNFERNWTIIYASLTWEYINDEFGPGYWYLDGYYLDAEGQIGEGGNGIYWLNSLGFGYPRVGTQHTPDGEYVETWVTVSIT
jgi:hypothetical protein